MPARVILPPGSISHAARDRLAAYEEVPAEPEWPALTDPDAWRAIVRHIDARMVDQLAPYVLHCPAEIEHLNIDGASVQVATPPIEHHPGAIYLDIHGGGFTCFGGEACNIFGRLLSVRLGIKVYTPDYRLPPDHAFPAGLDDCTGVYAYLAKRVSPGKIVVGGQSTGGNIAMALTLKAKREGMPLPSGLVLLTPHIDLTESGDSFQVLKGIDPGLPYGLEMPNRLYAGAFSLSDPAVSPLLAEIEPPFPSTFLQSGTRDLLLSNAVRLHSRMRKSGVSVDFRIYEAMPHGGFGGSPEDANVDEDLRNFIARTLEPLHLSR